MQVLAGNTNGGVLIPLPLGNRGTLAFMMKDLQRELRERGTRGGEGRTKDSPQYRPEMDTEEDTNQTSDPEVHKPVVCMYSPTNPIFFTFEHLPKHTVL